MQKVQKWLLSILALIGILGGANHLEAQTLAFENYTVENGLKGTRIMSISQTHDDLIWFGSATGGLFKFDGKTFINYNEKNGILNSAVFTVAEDNRKRLLIGSLKGLNISNDGKQFTTPYDKDSLTTSGVIKIFQDSKGRIWLGTAKGVAQLTDTIVTKFHEEKFKGKIVLNIEEDHL